MKLCKGVSNDTQYHDCGYYNYDITYNRNQIAKVVNTAFMAICAGHFLNGHGNEATSNYASFC